MGKEKQSAAQAVLCSSLYAAMTAKLRDDNLTINLDKTDIIAHLLFTYKTLTESLTD